MKNPMSRRARVAFASLFLIGSVAILSIAAYDGIRFWGLRATGHLETVVVSRVQVQETSSPRLRVNVHQQKGSETILTLIRPSTPIAAPEEAKKDRGVDGFLADLNKTVEGFNAPLPEGKLITIKRISDELVEGLYPGRLIEALVRDDLDDLALIGRQLKIGLGEWLVQPIILIGFGLLAAGVFILVLKKAT